MRELLIQNLTFLLLKKFICVPIKYKTKALQIPKSFHSWTSFSVQMLIGCLHVGEKKNPKKLGLYSGSRVCETDFFHTMTSVLGFLFCKMLVIFFGRWPEPCISLSSPLTPRPSPPPRRTHTSPFPSPSNSAPRWGNPPFFWLTWCGEKDQVMTSWKSGSIRRFQSLFSPFGPILFCFPAPNPWAKPAAPHTQQWWCPRQASATAGFKLQQLSPRVENFQNVLPWQPGISAQQKPPPRTPRLQHARRWASIYHFLQGKKYRVGSKVSAFLEAFPMKHTSSQVPASPNFPGNPSLTTVFWANT